MGGPEPGAALRLQGLTVVFEGSQAPAASVDLELVAGRVLALVGESGSGKSVTAMGALGLLPSSAKVTGSAVLDDASGGGPVELVGARRAVLDSVRGRLVGMVFQEPSTALDPLETIASQVGEAVRAHPGPGGRRLSRGQARQRVGELLSRVGLGEGEDRERIARSFPHQLSGGQLQRACMALALASGPVVLIADEPTTALDVTVQAGILDLLRSLAAEGVAVLLVTHDMAVVADVADDVAVMREGRIVERGEVRKIFASPEHPYTRKLLESVPRLRPLLEPSVRAQELSSEQDVAGPDSAVVQVRGLDVVYRNGRRKVHAVHKVSFSIAPGQALGLVGESGSGKSTIARALVGLAPVTAGSVRVCGVEVARARHKQLLPARRATGFVYQNPASSLNPRRSVGDSVAEPLVLHTRLEAEARRRRVGELLEAVRLPARMSDRYPHEMSGGQRQRVAIARALALDPQLVIADEPTSALDVSVQAVVLDLLCELQAELGFACLFVSHDLAVVDAVASRTAVLSRGRMVEQGPTAQILSQPQEDYTKRLVASVPVPDPVVQARRRRLRAA